MKTKTSDKTEEMRIRPKSDFLHRASWEELYVLTEHWESEVLFYRDEIRFLNNLIGKYFIWITKEGKVTKVQSLVNRLSKLHTRQEDIAHLIKKHLTRLELLMENAFTRDESKFREEHVRLEEQMTELSRELRKVKKEVFAVSGEIMESEKFQSLVPSLSAFSAES
jgi:hypothetical protein